MGATDSTARFVDVFGARLMLIWAGLALGVAFLATPAKFLAPSLTLPVALDVGRHTFRLYNRVELIFVAALLVGGAWSVARRRWCLALAGPLVIVASEALWLIPALDARVGAILAGQTHLPRSNLHTLYIGVEAVKALWLLGFGLAGDAALLARTARSSQLDRARTRA
jgi:hypothetical protein